MEFVLENELLKVTVTDFGAQVKSVVRKCDGVEHMWQADPAVWGYHAPILFPWCGRLKDGILETGGKTYTANTQHGFARTATHKLVHHSENRLVLELTDNEETLAIYPWHFKLHSIFVLREDTLHHTLEVTNTDKETIRFGIGYHPGFSLPFDDKHTFSDYELRFSSLESPICAVTAPRGLVNNSVYFLGSNIRSIPVTDGMFDNDSHCMLNIQSESLGLYEKDTGRGVVCSLEGFNYCLIWSKPGTPQFVCIEPWNSLPSYEQGSSVWEEKPAAAILEPGCRWSTTLSTSFVR